MLDSKAFAFIEGSIKANHPTAGTDNNNCMLFLRQDPSYIVSCAEEILLIALVKDY